MHTKLTCLHCPLTFTKTAHLQAHAVVHTGEREFSCPHCSNQYLRKDHLTRHVRSRHLIGPKSSFPCPDCNKSFQWKHGLMRHISQKHHDGNATTYLSCEICNESFVTDIALATHSIVHTGQRPFACTHCEKTYLKHSDLQKHEKCNHSDKICTACHETISDSEWKNHACSQLLDQAIEKELKQVEKKRKKEDKQEPVSVTCPFPGCSRTYKHTRNLTVHYKVNHMDETPHVCPILGCGKQFGYKHVLERHVATHDAKTIEDIPELFAFLGKSNGENVHVVDNISKKKNDTTTEMENVTSVVFL